MSGPPIRLFTDEQIDVALTPALRQRGYDAESCHEAGRANQSISDEEQLRYATAEGRAILTFNIADFYRLDADWKAAGLAHCGIIVFPECISACCSAAS